MGRKTYSRANQCYHSKFDGLWIKNQNKYYRLLIEKEENKGNKGNKENEKNGRNERNAFQLTSPQLPLLRNFEQFFLYNTIYYIT